MYPCGDRVLVAPLGEDGRDVGDVLVVRGEHGLDGARVEQPVGVIARCAAAAELVPGLRQRADVQTDAEPDRHCPVGEDVELGQNFLEGEQQGWMTKGMRAGSNPKT